MAKVGKQYKTARLLHIDLPTQQQTNKNTKYVLQELKISAIGNRENDDRQLLYEKVEKENTLKQNRKRKAVNINT